MKKKLTWANMILLFSLYTTQYLGLGFFTEALIGILRKNGMPLENLGFVYMLGLFWVFRFLWAPFIDKVKFKSIGHYRGWIIIFQFFMVTTLVIIAIFNIFEDLKIILSLIVFFAFFSASQDIALDALAFKISFKRQRPIVNAIKTSGGLIGMVLGGGIGLVLYSYIGWNYTLFILAMVTGISLVQLLFYKEASIKNKYFVETIDFKQYIYFWKTKEKKKWLLLLFTFPITISSAFAMITPVLVDLGWSLYKIGITVHIVGYGIGFLASFGTSWLINYYGRKKILIFAAIGQSLCVLMLLLLFRHHDSNYVVMFVVGLTFIFYTPSQVVMTTLMMDLSSKKTPASQFAIQHSIYTISGIIFSGISVSMAGVLGYEKIILLCSLVGIITVYIARDLDKITQKK